MWKFARTRVFILVPCAYLAGCFIPSIGLDLGVRGKLLMGLTRVSGTNDLFAVASVEDNGWSNVTAIALSGDQQVSVNGVQLIASIPGFPVYSGNLEAVDAPDHYAVAFDNSGDQQSMSVEPPDDFVDVHPAEGDSVSINGFSQTWAPSGDSDVKVDIEIFGPDGVVGRLTNLADDGSINISNSDLASLDTGDIRVVIRRFKEFDQEIGFAEGQVRLEIVKGANLNLE